MLPLWLSPTQVRLIPLSDKFIEKVEEIADKMEAQNIRVDIDDRAMTLQKRVREAETEWIPYIIVVGEREIESGNLAVRDREARGQPGNMTLEELLSVIHTKTENKPFKPLALPRNLSKRPQFHG